LRFPAMQLSGGQSPPYTFFELF